MKKLIIIITFLNYIALQAQHKNWSLKECIQYAMENDLVIKETALNQEFHEKGIIGAYGQLIPSASLYADNQYNFGSVIDPTTNSRVSSDIRSNSFNFSTHLELFNWGNFIRIKSAKLQKEKAIYDLEIKKNELIIQIVQMFYQIQFDDEQIKLAQQQLENTRTHLKRIEKEVELGNKAKSDLYELQANETADNQTLLVAVNKYELSKLNLQNLLNLREDVNFIPEETLDPFLVSDSLSDLYQTGLTSRPELKSAEIQLEIKQKSVEEMRSRYLPTINGNYSLSSFYVDLETAAFEDQLKNNRNHFLGLSINIPILNKFQTRTAIQQAKIEFEQTALQNQQQKQAYYKALSEAYLQTQNAYESWLSGEQNVIAQQKSFEKTEKKFRQGMVDAYGYFSAKNSLLSAQTALLQAKYTFHYQNVLLIFYVNNTVLH
ncbi:TolC family protein [Moheibacter sediminis]|uniref:Outer membrane protein n=1 Tax=Moheibacter sediminis TaxID=1434700 RepID=A0A1W1ZD40_9FLAO|nr:TolC family protein [Moheibacter sediminis]SMC46071.1 outer membrane protein [Moheibacter sediminis]